MRLDPPFDVIELEAKMPAEPVVGDPVVVTPSGAPVDEGFGDPHDLGDLLDGQVARGEEELELLRGIARLFLTNHVATSATAGK
jgi:hypothetical protein